ncbi:MAG TPA: hypothetical protein VMF13_12805 [Luteitalea sp.]|nr:hypothetical protein [Luteitalea sp.]
MAPVVVIAKNPGRADRRGERGVALISAILVTMLISAVLVGFVAIVTADQQASGLNRDQTQAYAAAHAGLEKLTSDLGDVFLGGNYSPSQALLTSLQNDPPEIEGFTYRAPGQAVGSGYRIIARPTETKQVPSGPFQGLVGLVTPYEITVTARSQTGGEVRMRRTMQTVGVPVFQFGIFSENDLSFHAGDDFSFGGRVHSNQGIFIASASGATLTLSDRVSAVGEIIRTHFANGRSASTYSGTVRAARASGCQAPPAAFTTSCRNLGANEGSLTGNVGSSRNSNWTSLSLGLSNYNSYIRTGLTGARALELPLVSDGASPIDIIRRPNAASPDPPTLRPQRFYNLASLRILLSDTAAEITALPDTVGTPVSLEAASLPAAAGSFPLAGSNGNPRQGYRSATGTALTGGYILINKQSTAGTWTDVTNEILALGISGRNLWNTSSCTTDIHANAVIRIQRVKESPATGTCGSAATSAPRTDFWPNTLYDSREALRRDLGLTSQNDLYLSGVMHYVEFDVNNYRRWLLGNIGASGAGSQNETGYVVYFSDRRTNKNAANVETGEFGWEDFVNTDSVSTPNNALNTGEDMNGNGALDTYGNTPRLGGFIGSTWTPYTIVAPVTSSPAPWGSGSPITNVLPTTNITRVTHLVNSGVARANRAVFFRRALKLVNGGLSQLPSNGSQGLTVASENPVYVQGNYNACGNATASCASNGFNGSNHRSAAIIADAVTLLSRNWNDANSFNTPHAVSGRTAQTTWYRMGVISGKGINFPFPNNNSSDPVNFGSDGGAHNFMRFLENWGSATFNYTGSMVSLYTSRQAVGTWKCCGGSVYSPPGRSVFFDEEFLDPTLLPPRTPMFRDVNTLTFRQLLRPTQ